MLISTDIILGMADVPDIFWGMADIPYIFSAVNTRCWGPAYVAADNIQSNQSIFNPLIVLIQNTHYENTPIQIHCKFYRRKY